jgi:hypothetical protein
MHYEQPIHTRCGMIWSHATYTFLAKPPAGVTLSDSNGRPAIAYVTTAGDLIHC